MSSRYSIAEARNQLPAIVHAAEEGSVAELTWAGISYRPLQPPVHVELAIARLKSTRADAALERFVEAARHACQGHDSRRAATAGDEAAAGDGQMKARV